MNASSRILRATTLSLALAAAPAIIGSGIIFGWTVAHAASGNDGGNNGNGGNGGNGGNNGNGGNAGANNGGNANAGGNGNSNGNSANPSGANNGNAGHSQNTGNGAQGKNGASNGQIASASGALNAAHASPSALAHAAPTSNVGRISTYDKMMLGAIAMPSSTSAQVVARNAAITAARVQLASGTNKTVTAAVITNVDKNLGLAATDPTLGTTQ